MSDFTSGFWSPAIAIITIVSVVACLLLLWFSGKARAMTAQDNTTGHIWDGDLRELNNPLPRWWVGLYVLTIVFSGVYLYLYPGVGSYAGAAGWTSDGQYEKEVAKGNEAMQAIYAGFAASPIPELEKNPRAMEIGQRLFLNNCAQCHGSDARGSKGFPNLTDNDWLWGGTPEKIVESITNGRHGGMPSQTIAVGGPDDIKNLANYVLSLSGSPHDSLRAAVGKSKFATCAACHGSDGKGNIALGSTNLTDNVWLHGYGENAIIDRITKGVNNVMPPQGGRLTPEQIKVLAAYVLSLNATPAAAKAATPAPTAATAPAAPTAEATVAATAPAAAAATASAATKTAQ